MITLDELKKEIIPYRDTLVICNATLNIVRLVNVIGAPEDSYWVYDMGDNEYHSSCVVGWTPLKGNLKDIEYKKLVQVWNLNYINKVI